jgi:hypothetical protein
MVALESRGGGESEDGRIVRPYTMTRGRTRTAGALLPLEALVRRVATGPAGEPAGSGGQTPERRRILDLLGDRILSVAEISAHLSLPLGVVRVLVADLAADRLVVVHAPTPPAAQPPAAHLKVLESVLDGISSL